MHSTIKKNGRFFAGRGSGDASFMAG